jgi:hypothetical protein
VAEPVAGDAAEFIARLRAGDRGAFEEFVRAQQHRVYGLALRMLGNAAEAQDVAQEVFIRAHRGLAEFGAARLSTWLYDRSVLLEPPGRESTAHRHGEELRGGDARRGRTRRSSGGARGGPPRDRRAGEERRIVVVLRDVEACVRGDRGYPEPVKGRSARGSPARLDLGKLERFFP